MGLTMTLCFTLAGILFGLEGNWSMVTLSVGLLIAVYFLVLWMVYIAIGE